MKPTITISYTILYLIDFSSKYGFTKCKKCFNLKTNREIKQVYKNGSIGYNIDRKFYSLSKLRNHLIKPKKEKLPF